MDDVEHQLPGMARVEISQREDLVHPARDDRDLQHVGVHRRHREQPDQAMLEDAAVGVLTHREHIRVRTEAQVTGHVGLGERQQFVVQGQPGPRTLAAPQHSEAGRRGVTRYPAVAHRAALIPEQGEMSGGQPAQQRGDVGIVVARIVAVGVGLDVAGQAVEDGDHRGRVRGDPAQIGQDTGQQAFGFVQCTVLHRR